MSRRASRRRARRTWPQRLLLGTNLLAVVGCLVIAGLIVYGHRAVGETPRVVIDTAGFQPASEVAKSDPVNFLVVGTDSSDGLAEDDPLRNGRDVGKRSDVIMIVRIDPKEQQARVISFPRDLWVDIPGKGSNKINAAMAFGENAGPSLLIDTIKKNFDIDINHYVEVNFASFQNVVKVIGGVNIYISQPLRDGHSGLYQPNTGCQNLDAGQALAYARSRHLFWQDSNGKWHNDPTSDLGRIARQKDFLRRVLQQAINKGARNPATLARLIEKVQGSVILDKYTTAQDLLDLGEAFRSFKPEELETADLPVVDVRRGGADTLDLVEPDAEKVLAQFRGTGATGIATEVDIERVTVRVENASGPEGAAIKATDALAGIGFQVRSPRDADPATTVTEVRFAPSDLAEAKLVARYLGGSPVLVEDADAEEIKVVIGQDFTGVLTNPRPESEITDATIVASTTTTSAATTTTTEADTAATSTSTGSVTTTTIDPPVSESYVPVSAGQDC